MRRWAILIAVAAWGCEGSRDRLLAALQSTRPEERALAVKKLADQGKPDDAFVFTRAAKDQAAEGRAICKELIAGLREIRGVAGAHVMAPAQGPEAIAQVLS